MVPGYFKKAILECEEEWSQHKKLYDTRGSIRGSVPPGFAYFAVGFGLQAGYAHHVEDEATWPKDFGRDVLEGLLEHPVTAASAALAPRPASRASPSLPWPHPVRSLHARITPMRGVGPPRGRIRASRSTGASARTLAR